MTDGVFEGKHTQEHGDDPSNPMRMARIKVSGWGAVYHCISRVVGGLALGQVLRLRVRCSSDGMVLGSPDCVNEIFSEYRDRFGPKRRTGARPMRGLPALENLATMRDLQVDVAS
ncbi:MAG: hypothetical protein BWX48_00931 [Verrucomicrobia bacterium ADurb.Bin006]|nr:MAG: hypothetical protein BWX48_00931 [Verrucomicrobia bacterium ADurb.Bin006]